MMRIALVGSRGQLGAALAAEFRGRVELTMFDRAALDITDPSAVAAAMDHLDPHVIINAAAYNAVDAAEDAPVDALQTNAFAVRSLARAARTADATLVHFSTDFVFDGTATAPYTEEDAPNPRSAYAVSKLLGEWFAFDAPRAYVLRVESLFDRAADGPPVKGSVAAIVSALQAGRTVRVFEDRTVSPTSVLDAARAVREMIDRQVPAGLYHCVNTGHCTWLELAREAARLLGVAPKLDIVRQADVKLKAERPQYCALSNAKLTNAGIVMPTWQSALAQYLEH